MEVDTVVVSLESGGNLRKICIELKGAKTFSPISARGNVSAGDVKTPDILRLQRAPVDSLSGALNLTIHLG